MTSRSPVNGVGYDKSLLADAPEITKADKQEGYNPDLLEQGKTSGRPSPRPGTVPPEGRVVLPPGAKYNGSDSSHGRGGRHIATSATAPPAKKQRSSKLWWIVAGIVLLLIIGIAVGVGVGVGTKKKGGSASNAAANNNGSTNGGKTSTDSTDNGGKTSTTDSAGDLVPVATPAPSQDIGGGVGGVGGNGGVDTSTTK